MSRGQKSIVFGDGRRPRVDLAYSGALKDDFAVQVTPAAFMNNFTRPTLCRTDPAKYGATYQNDKKTTNTNLLRRRARLRLLRRPPPLSPLQRDRSLPRPGQLLLELSPLLRRVRVRPPPLLPLRRPRERRRRFGLPGRLRQRLGLPLVGGGLVLLPRDGEGGGGLGGARGLRLGAQLEAALPLGLGGGRDEPFGFLAEPFSLPGRESGSGVAVCCWLP